MNQKSLEKHFTFVRLNDFYSQAKVSGDQWPRVWGESASSWAFWNHHQASVEAKPEGRVRWSRVVASRTCGPMLLRYHFAMNPLEGLELSLEATATDTLREWEHGCSEEQMEQTHRVQQHRQLAWLQ